MQLQDSQLPDKLQVAEALRLYSSFYRAPADWRALMDMLGLTDEARTRFGKLSGGQKRVAVLEAERLCDRVAMIDKGRIVALDTPAALTEQVETGQRIQFRPSVPLDDRLLTSLPDVTSVTRRGEVVVVTGTGNALNAVTSVLARNQIIARQLRVEQASLEDAFLALTGRHTYADQK